MTKERLVERLREADLDVDRFVQCVSGEKGTHSHDLLSPEHVSDVYGVYAKADDPLVWLDIDENPDELEDASGFAALMKLPPTLEQESPHHSNRRNGRHRAYKVTTDEDDNRTVVEVLEDEFGAANLQPSWGDVRAKNGYVVGAGSQLKSCDKDWHDCSEPGEGEYELARDEQIATISATKLVDTLRADPVYTESTVDDDDADRENTAPDVEPAEVLSYALNESGDDKLRRLWRGDYSDYSGDRSKAESALAYKLGFWLQGDKRAVRRAMNGENLPSDVSQPVLAKWSERGDSYRDSVLTAVDEVNEFFEPHSRADPGGVDVPDQPDATSPDLDESGQWFAVQCMYADSEVPQKHARQTAIQRLLDTYQYATPMDTDTVWVYDDERGIYDPTGEAHIREVLAEKLGPHYSNQEKNEILEAVRARTFIDRSEFDAGENDSLICVGNGVLDLTTGELLDHSAHYHFTRGVAHDYDPDAEAEAIESFLDTVVRREADKQTLLEMVGAALSPRYEQAKFMIVFGEGSNGKSTFFEIVEELLGEKNVAGWDLQDLSQNRFATSNLVGKFANIAPDMPGKKLTEVGTLKKLTGDDVTMAEKKGQDAFELKNTATLMFGANRPPAIPESSRALKRRIVPIRFPNEFTAADDGNPDKRAKDELMAELTTDEELSGLLNLAIAGLERLREQGDVSLPEDHDERLEYYEQFSDPIKEFRVNCLENASGTREKKSAIYDAYTRFCRANDYDPSDARVFWKQLRTTTLTVDESKPEIDGERRRVLNGVKFTPVGLEHAPESMLSENEPGSDATELATVAPEDDGLTVEAAVVESTTDTPDAVQQKLTLQDTSGDIEGVVWADANKPRLEEGQCYRLKNIYIDEYEGKRQLNVHAEAGVQEIQHGTGNAPFAEANDSADLDTAADGGSEEVVNLKPRVAQQVRQLIDDHPDGVPREAVIDAIDAPADSVDAAIDRALADQGRIYEPEPDTLRPQQ